MPAHGHGLSLLELLVALSIMVILAAMAAPSFREYLRNCQRSAVVNAVVHAIHAARTSAASSGTPVVLCGTEDLAHCSGDGDWSTGLIRRPDLDAAEAAQVIQFPAAMPRRLTSNRAEVRFLPRAAAATTATLVFCDDRGSRAARAIIISRTGRPRVSDRTAGGGLLACP